MTTSSSHTPPGHRAVISCEILPHGKRVSLGEGLQIVFGDGSTPFGPALIAWTNRGICHLAFHTGPAARMHEALADAWPHARWTRDDKTASHLLASIFTDDPHIERRFHLLLKGTDFQIHVWQALLATERGECVSYGELASRLGRPGAARAVGSAVAANAIAFLIPCHRVLRENGDIGQYRWGAERKAALLAHETPVVQKAADAS